MQVIHSDHKKDKTAPPVAYSYCFESEAQSALQLPVGVFTQSPVCLSCLLAIAWTDSVEKK